MVRKKIWDEDEHLDLILFDIPIEFPPEILDEAVQMLPVETDREDLTGLLIFSIDDASTSLLFSACSYLFHRLTRRDKRYNHSNRPIFRCIWRLPPRQTLIRSWRYRPVNLKRW